MEPERQKPSAARRLARWNRYTSLLRKHGIAFRDVRVHIDFLFLGQIRYLAHVFPESIRGVLPVVFFRPEKL
jgi:hypothetical protein